MGKSTKTQHLREKMRAAAKQSKQQTLDSLQEAPQKESDKVVDSDQKKHIVITEIGIQTKEDELSLTIAFKLLPSKTAFSKVKSDLWFDRQQISSVIIGIPQSPLATNDFELAPVLNMKGIPAGPHTIRAEMYELWASQEKTTRTSKEVTVDYVPMKKEDRLIRVPIVKSVAGTDLAIISDSEKNIYREIEEDMKKEAISRRDTW
jgi:hypothetical protein